MSILPELCISFYFLLAYCTLVIYVYILFVYLKKKEKKKKGTVIM